MEIFFCKISHFLTRFRGLWHSDWSIQWSHDLKWDLMRLWAYWDLGYGVLIKETLKETPKSHFLWGFWTFWPKTLLDWDAGLHHFEFSNLNYSVITQWNQEIFRQQLYPISIQLHPECLVIPLSNHWVITLKSHDLVSKVKYYGPMSVLK